MSDLEIFIQEVLNKDKVFLKDNGRFIVCYNNGYPEIWEKGRKVYHAGNLSYLTGDTWVDQLKETFHKQFISKILSD